MTLPENVLLVEDDKDDQVFFIEALFEIHSTMLCDVVNNGKEAIETLRKSVKLPSLIFMDINMPLMNGIECLSELKQNPRTKNIPVVMLTTSENQSEEAIKLGAKSFIIKPDNSKKLREELSQFWPT
ncbi:MAG: response regulator [Bacteroidota bacterium]